MAETITQATDSEEEIEDEVFSEPWDDSDVVLVVEHKEFHVHRWMLSFQSPVFKAMFDGRFKDSTQEKIKLKGDRYEAMSVFLKLLYPPNMVDKNNGKALINNKNVLSIVELADKYGAKNIIKQCLREVKHIQPENTMRLLPYAVRYELPVEEILDIIARHISTDTLENFAPELGNDSVHIKTLQTKCSVQENALQRANTVMMYLLNKHVTAEKNQTKKKLLCVQHNPLDVQDFKTARKCENCLMIYKRSFIDAYVYRKQYHGVSKPLDTSEEFIELLKLTEDIASSLQT